MTKDEAIAKCYKENFTKLANYIKDYVPPGIDPKDVVSNVFLVIMERSRDGQDNFINDDGTLNFFYVYRSCVNTSIKLSNLAKKIKKKPIEDYINKIVLDQTEETARQIAEYNIYENMMEIIDDMHWYDQKLLQLNIDKGYSMRKISRMTTITNSSIKNSIKNAKETIKGITEEDYQDYRNGDYHHIKRCRGCGRDDNGGNWN